MIFNSLTYLIFLSSIVILYWSLPLKPRLYLIFLASLVFYGFWRVEFIPVMLISVITDYFLALKIASSERIRKKQLLILSLFINIGLLFYFKYLIFFSDNAIGFANLLGITVNPILLNIILPLGISFYTFQTISYTVDVYRGKLQACKNFLDFSLYVSFFPQLVAGPIERGTRLLPQILNARSVTKDKVIKGLYCIFWGLFLKVVIADNIAFVNPATVEGITGFSVSLMLYPGTAVWWSNGWRTWKYSLSCSENLS